MIIGIIRVIIQLLEILIFLRVIISWIPNLGTNRLTEFIYFFTEPILSPIRNALHRIPSLRDLPIDLSPIAAYFLLWLISSIFIF